MKYKVIYNEYVQMFLYKNDNRMLYIFYLIFKDNLLYIFIINSNTKLYNIYLLHNIDFGSGIKPFNKYKYFH